MQVDGAGGACMWRQYLILDVDVGAVVDEKTNDVHVVVYEAVQDGKMKSRPTILSSNKPRSQSITAASAAAATNPHHPSPSHQHYTTSTTIAGFPSNATHATKWTQLT